MLPFADMPTSPAAGAGLSQAIMPAASSGAASRIFVRQAGEGFRPNACGADIGECFFVNFAGHMWQHLCHSAFSCCGAKISSSF
jgi:hypothetical protein